jgi:signal transduction histidine kinase
MFSSRQILLHYLSLFGVLNAIIQSFTLYFLHYNFWISGTSILTSFLFVITNIINDEKNSIITKTLYQVASITSIVIWSTILPKNLGFGYYFFTFFILMYKFSMIENKRWFSFQSFILSIIGLVIFIPFEGELKKFEFSSDSIFLLKNSNLIFNISLIFILIKSILKDKEKVEIESFNSVEKLMAIYENINHSMLFINPNLVINWCNQFAVREFDLTFNQELKSGINILSCIPSNLKEQFKHYIEKSLEGEMIIQRFEYVNSTLNKFFFNFQFIPVFDSASKIIGITVQIDNITKKVITEQELTQQKSVLEIIYNQSPDSLFIINPKTEKILTCNETAMSMFKLSKDSNINTYKKLFSVNEPILFWKTIHKKIEQFGNAQFEANCILENGNNIIGDVVIKRFDINESNHLLLQISDSTEKVKQREDQIALLNMKQQHTEQLFRQRNLETLVHGQEIERQRISKELHDGIGQMLTAIRLQVATLSDSSDPNFKEDKKEVNVMIDDTINEVKRISHNLMPSTISDLGLLLALENLFSKISKNISYNIEYEPIIKSIQFTKQQEIGLYRIIQEALNNALKYSKASHISLSIFINHLTTLQFMIEDNGIGFQLDDNKTNNLKNKGNGLTNMRERAKMIHADFKMESKKNKGTKIVISLPINLIKDGKN